MDGLVSYPSPLLVLDEDNQASQGKKYENTTTPVGAAVEE
jgi:hypothetical protein